MKKMPFSFTKNDGFLSVNRRFINYASSIFFKQYSKINSNSSLSLPSDIPSRLLKWVSYFDYDKRMIILAFLGEYLFICIK